MARAMTRAMAKASRLLFVLAGSALAGSLVVGCPSDDDDRCVDQGRSHAPGSTFVAADGCNTRTCLATGDVACTDKACPSGVCTYAGKSYAPSQTFPSEDGCNTCTCIADGGVACTKKACPAVDGGTPRTCMHGGMTYKSGASFPSEDGCNTCTCQDGAIACTLKACPAVECKRTGCSGQICSDRDVGTTCEFRPEYACYQKATCARQADGTCGFTVTAELKECLSTAGGKTDGGIQMCDFSAAYEYGDIGGLRVSADRSYLKRGNTYLHTRSAVRGDQPDASCAPPMPACGALDVITAYDIEVHDLAHADVQAALRKTPPPLFGRDNRPADGTVFEFKREDGRGFLVGTDCLSSDASCSAIPAGIKRLRDRLRALDAQQLASVECQRAGLAPQ